VVWHENYPLAESERKITLEQSFTARLEMSIPPNVWLIAAAILALAGLFLVYRFPLTTRDE